MDNFEAKCECLQRIERSTRDLRPYWPIKVWLTCNSLRIVFQNIRHRLGMKEQINYKLGMIAELKLPNGEWDRSRVDRLNLKFLSNLAENAAGMMESEAGLAQLEATISIPMFLQWIVLRVVYAPFLILDSITATGVIDYLGAFVPRAYREGFVGDLYEDVNDYRAQGKGECWLIRHVLWQFSILTFCRCKKVLSVGAIAAWVAAKFKN